MTTFLDQTEFDTNGGAVGPGKFSLPSGGPTEFQLSPHDRLGIGLYDGHLGKGAKIYPISAPSVRGVSEAPHQDGPTLELSASFAIFLEQHLGRPKPSAVSLEQNGGADWDYHSDGLAKFRFVKGEKTWLQVLTEIRLTITPDGPDRIVTVDAIATGPAMTAGFESSRDIFGEDARLSISVRISEANLCVVFGAWPGRDGQFPWAPILNSPTSRLDHLNARAVLVGGANIFAWSGKYATQCWSGRNRPLTLRSASYGRRADSLLEGNQSAGLVLELTANRVEELLRTNLSADLLFDNPDGSLGHICMMSGRTAAEEGSHRRNVIKWNGNITLDNNGLAMNFIVHLGDYLPETIRGSPPLEPGKQPLKIDLLLTWETLILSKFVLRHHWKAILADK